MMDLSQFLLVTGLVFLVTTTTIAIFKKEKKVGDSQEEDSDTMLDLSPIAAYKILWRLLWCRRMFVWIVFQLTGIFCFSAAENIFKLKLVEMGVPREDISILRL